MASLSLAGPTPNPDLDHTQSHDVAIYSHDTTVDGVSGTIMDITDASHPVAGGRVSITYVPGTTTATATVSRLADDKLYLLTVSKEVDVVVDRKREKLVISVSMHMDTRPAGINARGRSKGSTGGRM